MTLKNLSPGVSVLYFPLVGNKLEVDRVKDVSTQCVVLTLGVGVAVLLNIWSDKLTKPIKGKSAEVLSEEMAQNSSLIN